MNLIDVDVHYLEMRSRPASGTDEAPCKGLQVIYVNSPTVAYYRFLYHEVGNEFHWLSRRKMSDQQLQRLLEDPGSELYVLHHDGSPIGFAELDCRDTFDVELVQFGLIRPFFGRGIGKWFLRWVIDKVWDRDARRFWLHTCTLDHEAAIPNYLKAGFVEFKRESIRREL